MTLFCDINWQISDFHIMDSCIFRLLNLTLLIDRPLNLFSFSWNDLCSHTVIFQSAPPSFTSNIASTFLLIFFFLSQGRHIYFWIFSVILCQCLQFHCRETDIISSAGLGSFSVSVSDVSIGASCWVCLAVKEKTRSPTSSSTDALIGYFTMTAIKRYLKQIVIQK